jgi:uncharacterized YigZ family protein
LEISDSYYTIEENNVVTIKVNRSNFIAQTFPVKSDQEISEVLENVKKKYYNARHHPFAYRIGLEKINFKTNDDGEPAGTAGKPILEVIDKFNLTNVIVVVTRYFGGVKLGVGGLRRAFFDTAEECIKSAKIIERFLYENLKLEFEYKFMNGVMRLLEEENVKNIMNESDEKVKLNCEVRLSKTKKLKEDLMNITNGTVKISFNIN